MLVPETLTVTPLAVGMRLEKMTRDKIENVYVFENVIFKRQFVLSMKI